MLLNIFLAVIIYVGLNQEEPNGEHNTLLINPHLPTQSIIGQSRTATFTISHNRTALTLSHPRSIQLRQPSSNIFESTDPNIITQNLNEEESVCNSCWEITNIVAIFLSCIILIIDFEGQSALFSFVVDCLDIAITLCCVAVVIIGVILQLKTRGTLTKLTIADVVITGVSLSGLVYEAVIAKSFE